MGRQHLKSHKSLLIKILLSEYIQSFSLFTDSKFFILAVFASLLVAFMKERLFRGTYSASVTDVYALDFKITHVSVLAVSYIFWVLML